MAHRSKTIRPHLPISKIDQFTGVKRSTSNLPVEMLHSLASKIHVLPIGTIPSLRTAASTNATAIECAVVVELDGGRALARKRAAGLHLGAARGEVRQLCRRV